MDWWSLRVWALNVCAAVFGVTYLGSSGLSAQEPVVRFTHLTADDGLPHARVNHVHQDPTGFLWFATREGLARWDGYQFYIFQHDPSDPESLVHNHVMHSTTDDRGRLWVATNGGLDRFDADRESFVHFPPAGTSAPCLEGAVDKVAQGPERLWVGTAKGLAGVDLETEQVTCFLHDPEDPRSLSDPRVNDLFVLDGTLWVGTFRGLNRLDGQDAGFTRFLSDPGDPAGLSHEQIHQLAEGPDGRLWVGTSKGLSMVDPRSGEVEQHRGGFPALSEEGIFALHMDQRGDMWVGSGSSGLFRFLADSEEIRRYQSFPQDRHSLIGNGILSIGEDRSGLVWISTYVGVSRYDRRSEQFATYRVMAGSDSTLSSNNISGIWLDHEDLLWVGTWDKGLNCIDRRTSQIRHYSADPAADAVGSSGSSSLSSSTVSALVEDRDHNLWVGTPSGLAMLGPERREPVWLSPDSGVGRDLIRTMVVDDSGRLWLGTDNGLYATGPVPSRGDFELRRIIGGRTAVDALFQDRTGILWVGTRDFGLLRLSPEQADAQAELLPAFLRPGEGWVTSLAEDGSGVLWIGTDRGLYSLDADRGVLRRFESDGSQRGPSTNFIIAILVDDGGQLWLSTTHGLNRFDPSTGVFTFFDREDGLQSNTYSTGSAHRARSGELFFGGSQGFDSFFPENIRLDPFIPTPVFTQLRIGNQPVSPRSEDSPLERSLQRTEHLVLGPSHRMVSFDFAALHFADPPGNRYSFQLDGFDPDWLETSAERRSATYTNIPAGEYTFRLKVGNPDGVWNPEPATLAITVVPPWWKSPWSYTLYALALITSVGLWVRSQQAKLKREQAVSAQLRQVDKLKDEFLANTSHELRTPLFGMVGLAESLHDDFDQLSAKEVRRQLDFIVHNGQRIGGLVDDILDFSKLKHGELDLELKSVDLCTLTDVVLTLLEPLTRNKDLQLINAIDPKLPGALADEQRLQQILHNLLGNAVKFTEQGTVEVSARVDEEGQRLVVRVADTGIGIAEQDQTRIFRSFQQADASSERTYGGTGLGLAIARRLVESHGGKLWVESQPGEGTQFFFTLLVSEEPAETYPALLPTQEPMQIVSEESSSQVARPDSFQVLAVDDEAVVRQVLANHLRSAGYRVLRAKGGDEALRLLEEHAVDLVLLDVMMPKKSGYEVCREIRRQRSLEELPVLFLSAKHQVDDLMIGFAEGANDYLHKPISKNELLARVAIHLQLLEVHRGRGREVKALRGLLPICAQCKKIRDDRNGGTWSELETYLDSHSDATLTHGLCPDCLEELSGAGS